MTSGHGNKQQTSKRGKHSPSQSTWAGRTVFLMDRSLVPLRNGSSMLSYGSLLQIGLKYADEVSSMSTMVTPRSMYCPNPRYLLPNNWIGVSFWISVLPICITVFFELLKAIIDSYTQRVCLLRWISMNMTCSNDCRMWLTGLISL